MEDKNWFALYLENYNYKHNYALSTPKMVAGYMYFSFLYVYPEYEISFIWLRSWKDYEILAHPCDYVNDS